jgi:hypothetical protein
MHAATAHSWHPDGAAGRVVPPGYAPVAPGHGHALSRVEFAVAPIAPPRTRARAAAPTLLARSMREFAARSSSAAIQAAAQQQPAQGPRAQAGARRRADEARVQQLRGVFAAYDADGDGWLSVEQLTLALLALGLQPVAAVVTRFTGAAPPHPGAAAAAAAATAAATPRAAASATSATSAQDATTPRVDGGDGDDGAEGGVEDDDGGVGRGGCGAHGDAAPAAAAAAGAGASPDTRAPCVDLATVRGACGLERGGRAGGRGGSPPRPRRAVSRHVLTMGWGLREGEEGGLIPASRMTSWGPPWAWPGLGFA